MSFRGFFPLAALAAVACSTQSARPPPEEPVSTTSVTSAALSVEKDSTRAAVAPRDDDAFEARPLAAKYRSAFSAEPALAGVPLESVVVLEEPGGHVVLRGRVPWVADAVRIEMAVRRMKGVTSVTNELETYRR